LATATKKPRFEVKVKNDWCKGCGICLSFCPKGVLAMNDEGKVYVKNPEKCAGCGNCEIYCPDFAITLGRLDNESKRQNTVNAR